ncbi:hypothetical protein F0562_018289 [Nyssa sinensis]|uniref:Uncharacterized protein n=1 Tax=Nyssa sinensis TaxID=561372 RepID=A0A5J4ZB37_9ASTE|nr:hypothetical protein F0562_018289 [Nyssa sinensis]
MESPTLTSSHFLYQQPLRHTASHGKKFKFSGDRTVQSPPTAQVTLHQQCLGEKDAEEWSQLVITQEQALPLFFKAAFNEL